MKKFITLVFSLAIVATMVNEASAQNLAGVTITTNLGQDDPNTPCVKRTGDNGGVRHFRDGASGSCPDKVCFNQNLGCGAYCLWDEFGFKNIINLPVCITVNTNAGGCGFNVFASAFAAPYVIPVAGTWCDNNPSHISDAGVSGTSSFSFEIQGCSPFYIHQSPVFNTATCSYNFVIDTDPLLDLRCVTDPAVCIEKVKIGGTPVPTMTQWGLFLFGLIVLTLGVVTIYNMSTRGATERS